MLGTDATLPFSAAPDIKEWSDTVALDPARIPPGYPASAALDNVRERLAAHTASGLAKLRELTSAAIRRLPT